MLDRRSLLLAGAATLAGCAHASAPIPAAREPDPERDAALRRLVERLAEHSRQTRIFFLRRFDASRLTPQGRILLDAVLPGAEADAALARRRWGADSLPYAVTHRNGAYRRAGEMREVDDVRALLRAVTRDTNRLEGDAGRGVIAPDFLIDAALPLVEAAAQRVGAADGDDYRNLAEALSRQAATLRTLRVPAGSDAGVWRLPDGESFYAQTLQFQLGAAVDPRAAHERALARCRELQAQADALLRAQGLTRGDVGARLRQLAADARFLYSDDEPGRDRAVADMAAALEAIRSRIGAAIPGAETAPGEVRRLAREVNGTQGRRIGPVYEVDLGNIRKRPAWTLPSVVHHELIPGHILQGPYARSAAAPALQQRYSLGYAEGWAIYAEALADALGAFDEAPLARIGYLQWMLFRLARVVADTGVHVMRWSRARAVEEMYALQGDAIAFVSIEDDVDRLCAQPGSVAAQGLAALHIAELHETMRRERGYDAARFHLALLGHGPLAPGGLEAAARAALTP